jgi:hypothetical protein
MQKIRERVDLSKKVLEIDIESEIFYSMMEDLNKEVQRCVKKVFDEEFESGEISVKLNIEIPNAYKDFPRTERIPAKLSWTLLNTVNHYLNTK